MTNRIRENKTHDKVSVLFKEKKVSWQAVILITLLVY